MTNQATHWYAPDRPAAFRVDLRIDATTTNAWKPDIRPTVECRRPLALGFSSVRAISVPISRLSIRTQSFSFPEPTDVPAADDARCSGCRQR